jgi:hypothetical protein
MPILSRNAEIKIGEIRRNAEIENKEESKWNERNMKETKW